VNLAYSQLIGPTTSGTSGSPITLQAYPGESVNVVCTGGNQPVFGTDTPTVNYVRFLGFTVDPGPGVDYSAGVATIQAAFNISGIGNEIGYCEVIGRDTASTDNHDGIRLNTAFNTWIHHNNVHSVTGGSVNSTGLKMYESTLAIVEDNYFHGCTAGMFDKTVPEPNSSSQNTFRRNWSTANQTVAFNGNEFAEPGYTVVGQDYLYDNVFDGLMQMGGLSDSNQLYNNLVRVNPLPIVWANAGTNINLWNNINIGGGGAMTAYYDITSVPVPGSGPPTFNYFDYNVYDGTPSYEFSSGTISLATIQGLGFETHSAQDTAADIFVDQISYVLKTAYQTAGRYGDQVGPRSSSPVGPSNTNQPNSIAQILNPFRYGPAAAGFGSFASPISISGVSTRISIGGTSYLVSI